MELEAGINLPQSGDRLKEPAASRGAQFLESVRVPPPPKTRECMLLCA